MPYFGHFSHLFEHSRTPKEYCCARNSNRETRKIWVARISARHRKPHRYPYSTFYFFELQAQTTGSVIGEIAADIKQSTARALSGEAAPKPTPPPQDFGQLATIVALCAAGLAVMLGGVGLYRNEPHRLSYLAVGIGISAFVMQYVFWLAILICGIALLISIVENLGSIFD